MNIIGTFIVPEHRYIQIYTDIYTKTRIIQRSLREKIDGIEPYSYNIRVRPEFANAHRRKTGREWQASKP
jgi:hypothetical protein